jgi:uncharacterized membrane protein
MSFEHAPVFEALIVPHRSLTRRGACGIVAAMLIFSAGVALRFWFMGAWPVVIFSLLDVPLLVALLAINQHRARASELIMLHTDEITIVRTDAAGRRTQDTLPAAWLHIDLSTGQGTSKLTLSSRGRDCEVGAFLHEPAKVSLFDALRDGLYRANNRRFDNPQLREG